MLLPVGHFRLRQKRPVSQCDRSIRGQLQDSVVGTQNLAVLSGAESPGPGLLTAGFRLMSPHTLVLATGHPDQTSRQVPGQGMVGEQLPPQWNRPGAPDTHGLIETPPLDLEHGGDLLAREG